jgi:transcriptional regulator with XRE-family HTH domain
VPNSPEAAQLAGRLRQLRMQWTDERLTQAQLAAALALGTKEKLSAATVSSWENGKDPKLPPRHRLEAYARFFATRRSVETSVPQLLLLANLSRGELAAYEELKNELYALRARVSRDSPEDRDIPAARSWRFNVNAPVVIVCAELPADQRGPLANPLDRNRTELHGFADADSLIELFGHIRAENPQLDVEYKTPSSVEKEDLTGHLVILGGVIWNEISERLSEMAKIPVKQVEDKRLESGEIFVSEADGEQREYFPRLTKGDLLSADVGLLARVPNPLNSSHTLTICNGIHSRGVYGAVSALTDKSLRDSNERYISANFGNSAAFAILMSVEVIRNDAVTPDFNGVGVVLYKWPSSRS